MPDFQNPLTFLLLLIIPLLYILRKLKLFSRISFPAVLSDWGGKPFEWDEKAQIILSKISKACVIAGFLFAVFALSDPVISRQEKVYTSLGTDVVFVIDSSPSMSASDINGYSRIDAAKNTIIKIINENDGIRVGIVAFGSDASVFVPPTTDHQTVIKRLAEIKIGILGENSSIGDGLSTAVCHLATSSAPNKCIILLTDGENNGGTIHPETAATLAKSKKITIYVVGIGSKGNVHFEYEDPVAGTIKYGDYNSNFNSASLRKIASLADGRYFEVKTSDELIKVIDNVTKKENVVQNFTYRIVKEQLYDKFLFWAILFISAAWIIKRIFLNEIV